MALFRLDVLNITFDLQNSGNIVLYHMIYSFPEICRIRGKNIKQNNKAILKVQCFQ